MNATEARQFETTIDAALTAGDLPRAEALAGDYCRAAEPGPAAAPPERTPHFRAAYLAAQVALAAGRLGRAVDHLAPFMDDVPRLPAELAARVRLLLAEAHARLDHGPEARSLLDEVPTALLEREPLLQLRALRIRLWLGEVDHLTEALDHCCRSLEARGDTANLALLLCEEGRGWDRAGKLARAEQCWLRAEHLGRAPSPRPGRDPVRADVMLQLARLDHLRGHLPRALERYEKGLGWALPGAQTIEMELRRLLVRLDLNQWDQVRTAADRLLSGLPLEQLPEEVRPLAAMVRGLLDGTPPAEASDEVRAYHAAARGDGAAARALYHQALATNPSPERRARLALALGLLALTHADRAEALSWLRQSEALSRSLELPEVLIRTLQVCGQLAAEEPGNDDLARRLFEEAVLLSEVQAGLFTRPLDALSYREGRGGVLRYLLRSACRRGDAGSVFHYQELERGRLLLDLLQTAPGSAVRVPLFHRPEVAEAGRLLAACEEALLNLSPGPDDAERRRELLRRREELRLRRDQLFEDYLRDRGRRPDAVLPTLPDLAALRRALPPAVLYAAPVLADEELYLLAVTRDGPPQVLRAAGSGKAVCAALEALRGCLGSQLERYRRGFPLGRPERTELDQRLEALGHGLLGALLAQALAGRQPRPRRLLWVPDGPLHGLPVQALRRDGRYLVEDCEVVWAFSGAMCVHQAFTRRQTRGAIRPAVVVTETSAVLPEAAREGQGVAASFLWSRVLHGAAGTRQALRRLLARARAVHFACHAHFDGEHPLAAAVALPSQESLHALEWLEEPVKGLPLVTLSACRSAEVAPFMGGEMFGLVTGLLGGGVRAVLASLWPVADREALGLMWRFYRERLTSDLGTALARAQRAALTAGDGSPLFWAAFALFGDAAALPAPGPLWRWLARWRRERHGQRFPSPSASGDSHAGD
jgi:tetratricopeptide (TPR) repeat protein